MKRGLNEDRTKSRCNGEKRARVTEDMERRSERGENGEVG